MNFGKCGSSRILNAATVTFSQLRSQKYPSFQAFKLLEVNFHSRASLKYSEWRKRSALMQSHVHLWHLVILRIHRTHWKANVAPWQSKQHSCHRQGKRLFLNDNVLAREHDMSTEPSPLHTRKPSNWLASHDQIHSFRHKWSNAQRSNNDF